jgi:S1-C subfamily serine protease
MQIQATHRAVREAGFVPEQNGVFISRWHHGSPAHRYGVYALNWITSVNGAPTPDLDAFVAQTKELAQGQYVRISLVSLNTKRKVLALKLDPHYWPTWELRRMPGGDFRRFDEL